MINALHLIWIVPVNKNKNKEGKQMGRKIIALTLVILTVCLMTFGVYATEEVAEATEVIEETTLEVVDTLTELVEESATEVNEVTEEVTNKNIFSLTADDVAFIKSTVESASSKAKAIISIAARFDITVEDAEKFIDTVVQFGDKIYGEDADWVKFKEDVFANKRFYSSLLIVGVCGLVLILMLILMLVNGSRVKMIKSDRDTDMAATDEYREAFENTIKNYFNVQFEGIKEILKEGETIEGKEDAIGAELKLLVKEFDESRIAEIRASLQKSEETTNAALKIVHQTSLHNLQLLYLIMGKTQLPIANEESRKLWYEEAINNVNRMMPKESEDNAGES